MSFVIFTQKFRIILFPDIQALGISVNKDLSSINDTYV